jgi:hypothetical protein
MLSEIQREKMIEAQKLREVHEEKLKGVKSKNEEEIERKKRVFY